MTEAATRLCRLASTGAVLALILGASSCSEKGHPEETEVRAFLERYFSTWSARDMEGYGASFDPRARIAFVTKTGDLHAEGVTDFLHGQKLAHAQAAVPMIEIPTEMKITFDARVTLASVRWKLTKGAEIVTGTDNFTLIKTATGWKIISLVFYND